jgi:ABC-type transport system involved in multi-copper enzyme maturation permease subunit
MSPAASHPTAWRSSLAIARVTFIEILRDKILYNVLLCGIFLVFLGFIASRLSSIRPERVLLDFGHFAISTSCAMIAVFLGAGMIGREFERRTVHMALARPIARAHFVLGKFLGIVGVISLNWALFFLAYLGILFWLGPDLHDAGTYVHQTMITLFCAVILCLLQSFVLAATAILFSTFSTTSLSVMFTVGVYLVGVNISHLHAAIAKLGTGIPIRLLDGAVTLLPNLEHFDLGTQLTYSLPVGSGTMFLAIAYALVVCGVLLCISGFLIQAKEI